MKKDLCNGKIVHKKRLYALPQRVIDAKKVAEADGNIHIKKTCPEHGEVSVLIR